MFKLVVVCIALVAVVAGRPQQNPADIQLLKYENNNDGSGNYNFEYEQSDGQKRQETGELKRVDGAEEDVVVMTGNFQWVDADGVTHTVTYTADENGFHPVVSK